MSETKQLPSKEEIVKYYNEQIEIAELSARLAGLLADKSRHELERLKNTVTMAQIQSPDGAQQQGQPHVVTQEDLDANPELAENGVVVGQTILINNPTPVVPEVEETENPDLKIV